MAQITFKVLKIIDSDRPQAPILCFFLDIRWGTGSFPHEKGHLVSYLGMPRLARNQYSQRYSLRAAAMRPLGHQSIL